jgi:competence protein ComGC
MQPFLGKLRNNPKLKALLIIAVIVILAIAVILLIFMLPLLMKFMRFISENGIQGIIDIIWKGTK